MEEFYKPLSYYAKLEASEVLSEQNSSNNGLTSAEAHKRLEKFGKNVLVEEKKKHILIELLSGFKNPLVLILLFAAYASFIVGELFDALIIAIIIVLSTIFNFFQEYKASNAAQKLKAKVATTVAVVRDGKQEEIKISQVCVGDVVLLNAGDLIPADARVMSAKDFFVNESALTGESFPIEKSSEKISSQEKLQENHPNVVLSGTDVITGSATVLVVATGKYTEFGKIGQKLSEAAEESEFTKGIKSFSLLIMRTTIFFVLFIFFFNSIIKRGNLLESFTFAIAIAVGLTPELLPIIMSITMAQGSLKMAKKGAIVKKLSAIPNFGSMDILCTDKTGTLTEDKIRLVKYTDVFGNHSEKVLLHAYLNSFFQTGIQNPMDEAVLNYKKIEHHGFEKIDEIPFDFVRKKMSIVVCKQNKRYLITKGAPEEVFKSCTFYKSGERQQEINTAELKKIQNQFRVFSADGYRVLAIAIKEVAQKQIYTKQDENDLELLGFIAFFDNAKEGVLQVLQEIHKMGIEVKVITGDNELVTKKICKDVGLEVKGVVTGGQIEHLADDALKILAQNTTIFARFSPDEKNRIIQALKQSGHVVGYLGDGINDAPSFKTADVGISVNNAVDVAKESADIILTHKSLKELQDGVLEGRKTYGNTLKYIQMGISSNFGNMFSVVGAILFIPFLPMLPIQILLNNFLYDVSQITIPTDHVDKEFTQMPKRWNINFLKHFMFVFGPLSSLFDFLIFYLLYGALHVNASLFQTSWFVESLTTQTLVVHVIRTRKIPFLQSFPSKYLMLSSFLIVLIGWLIPFTFIGEFFHFQVLSLPIIALIIEVVLLYLITIEIAKRIFYNYFSL